MLLWLAHFGEHYFHALRVFQYITFRTIVSALTSLVLVLCLSPAFIRWLHRNYQGQPVRDDGPQSHLKKSGTPTMGGLLILMAISISVLLWGNLHSLYLWIVLAAMWGFGALGACDDLAKLKMAHSKGLSARSKFLIQSVMGLAIAFLLYHVAHTTAQLSLTIPFVKSYSPYLALWFVVLAYFVIVGCGNAVNLTDGLDGLATMPILLIAAALGVFAYVEGHHLFSSYLAVPHIPEVSELCVFSGALVGACLGFLWYNTFPADMFMGDVGSLGLGAVLGVLAVMVRQELVLFIMGGVFVMETLSVILQVGSFKLRGKRIFLMAPLHHHFELKGWPEPRVIVRFWIMTFIFVLIGLATLKLR